MRWDQRFARVGAWTALGLASILTVGGLVSSASEPAPLAPNDVSILFPLPGPDDDLSGFISVGDLTDASGARLLTDEDFGRFSEIAQGSASKIGTVQISFPTGAGDVKSWIVAGIRIDPGAPGLSGNFAEQFGPIPQIRLIAQPVTRGDDSQLEVHDIAAHLIFNFAKIDVADLATKPKNCLPKFVPDNTAFLNALKGFVALRDGLAEGETAGSLRVHPGLAGAAQESFRDKIVAVLKDHLKPTQLNSMAVMGIPSPAPEPWIFVAMTRDKDGKLNAVPSPAAAGMAQMLTFMDSPNVQPQSMPDNGNEISRCLRAPGERKGLSTAELFDTDATEARTTELTAVIADPAQSHFFNTDCVSCHTETRLLRTKIPSTTFPGMDEAVLPGDTWNVRNFGWAPDADGFKPTITRRTANETAEVVKRVNELLH